MRGRVAEAPLIVGRAAELHLHPPAGSAKSRRHLRPEGWLLDSRPTFQPETISGVLFPERANAEPRRARRANGASCAACGRRRSFTPCSRSGPRSPATRPRRWAKSRPTSARWWRVEFEPARETSQKLPGLYLAQWRQHGQFRLLQRPLLAICGHRQRQRSDQPDQQCRTGHL
jgi:hypothetical protein